jgi:RHS repeat-associated protein
MSDLDRYQYGYDQNSNRLWKANVVGTPIVSGGLDERYSYNDINRLTQMQRGTLSGGVITGTPVRQMDYTLDPTGNWNAYLTKTNGTTDLNQTRSHNMVNEIEVITSTPGWASPPSYDAAGNMTSFPQPASPTNAFTATYDAWNRMVSVNDSGGAVATYRYDGRNRRIVKNTVATSETRHFYYTSNWQDIEERTGSSTSMDKQYVWGVQYIDELICRDDATPERLYACQDANFNLTAITDTGGTVVERYGFDPYGNRTIYDGSWTPQSTSGYSWVVGFQGLVQDSETSLIYVRNRYLHSMLGIWMQRDPLGIHHITRSSAQCSFNLGDELIQRSAIGMNLYQVEESNPITNTDPSGLFIFPAIRCFNAYFGTLPPNALKELKQDLLACAAQMGVIGLNNPQAIWDCLKSKIVGSMSGLLNDAFANFVCCAVHPWQGLFDPLNPSQAHDYASCGQRCDWDDCVAQAKVKLKYQEWINTFAATDETESACICACAQQFGLT